MNPASASTAPSTVCPIQTTAPVKMTVLTFSYPRRQDFQACVGHSNLQGMSNALRLKMHHISRHASNRADFRKGLGTWFCHLLGLFRGRPDQAGFQNPG